MCERKLVTLLLLLLLYANLVTLASFCSTWTLGPWYTLKMNTCNKSWVRHTLAWSAKKTIDKAVINNAHCNPLDIFATWKFTVFLQLLNFALQNCSLSEQIMVADKYRSWALLWRQMETNAFLTNEPGLPSSRAHLCYQVILARPVKCKHKGLIKHLATHSLLSDSYCWL